MFGKTGYPQAFFPDVGVPAMSFDIAGNNDLQFAGTARHRTASRSSGTSMRPLPRSISTPGFGRSAEPVRTTTT
jgi:hypothetical protein